jgi:hypothetical protein
MDDHLRATSQRTSLLDLVSRLLNELPGLISDRVELLSLELRRAGESLATMVVLGLVATILLLTAWAALWIGLAFALIDMGLHWGWALAIVLALNIGGAVFALLRVRALAGNLTLPATKRRLTLATMLGPDTAPPTPPPSHEQSYPEPVRPDGR